jgi:hypothetical protein
MIADASPITDTDLLSLSRAFAARAMHPKLPAPPLFTDHQNELLQSLGQRFLLLDRAMLMSTEERFELAQMLEIGGPVDGCLQL